MVFGRGDKMSNQSKKEAKGFCFGALVMTLIWQSAFLVIPEANREFSFLIGMFAFPLICIIRMIIEEYK